MSLTDPGSRETRHTSPDKSPAADAPDNTPLEDVAEHLLDTGAPDYASQIDPDTLEAPFEPIEIPPSDTLPPADTIPDTQETATQESTTSWGKIAKIGGTVLGLAAASAAIFIGSRGSEDDPENTVPKPPTTVAGPVTPGPATPSPQATQEQGLSPLEEQRRLFERVQIPASAITAAELEQYVDPNALDLFVGVDGGIGLYPEVKRDLSEHKKVFDSLTIDDVAASMDRLEKVVTGTHLDVVDGKVVPVANSKLLADGVFRAPVSKELFVRNSEGLTAKGAGVAGTLADVARDSTTIRTAAEMMKAEQRVAEHYAQHPDETGQINNTNSAGLIESTFASHGTVEANIVDSRLALALRVASGDVTTIDSPNYADSRVVGVHEKVLKNADGTQTVSIIGVSLIGADQSGELYSAYVTLVPATTTMGPSPDGPTFEPAPPQEDTFNALLVGKSSPNE
jgi:hypothetical protein